jgi:pantoate--beta-alanine ligase
VQVVESVAGLRRLVAAARRDGKSVGLVPTMGFLHDGHATLIRRAAAECASVVVSIFVNPTQFGQGEDFHSYPRDLQRDLRVCAAAGAAVVFAPPAAEVYPSGFRTHVEVEGLGTVLCGASRPGHFRGVATVVAKLFGMVRPDRAYFGQKDYQQTLVIRRMTADLNLPVEVVVVPTVRHDDGLAMSSRNTYLGPAERAAAPALYRMLQLAEQEVAAGQRDAARLRQSLLDVLASEPLAELDYLAITHPLTLEPVDRIEGRVLVALAVRIGRTRLIDNLLIDNPPADRMLIQGATAETRPSSEP